MAEDNQKEKSKDSCSHSRRTVAYPPPKTHKLLTDYVDVTGDTESSIVSKALKEFFERNPREDWLKTPPSL